MRRLKILHNGQTKRYSKFFKFLGPGLITGAADDDPSGIATYSQAGATYGFGQLWSIALCLPLMIAVQETCARIGSVTGKGLVKVTSEIYSKKILYAVVSLVVIANVINIGADIAAVGAALNLLIPLSAFTLSSIFTLVVLLLEIVVGYHAYAKFLKFLALSLLAYVATAFIVGPDWGEVFRSLVIPKITWEANYWYVLVALLETTISPYMFFWQATEEVEEQKYAIKAGIPKRSLKVTRRDNTLGIPVLAGSVSYAISDTRNWPQGLDSSLHRPSSSM